MPRHDPHDQGGVGGQDAFVSYFPTAHPGQKLLGFRVLYPPTPLSRGARSALSGSPRVAILGILPYLLFQIDFAAIKYYLVRVPILYGLVLACLVKHQHFAYSKNSSFGSSRDVPEGPLTSPDQFWSLFN